MKKIINNKFDKNNIKYYLFGIYFLFFQIYINYTLSFNPKTDLFFWICNLIPILFAFGFFFKNISLIGALINISLFPQVIWLADFFSILIFDYHFLGGFTKYIFQNGTILILPVLVHTFSTFIALIAIYKVKFDNYLHFVYSFFLIIIFQMLSLTFTDPINNINCAHYPCIVFNSISYYIIIYPIGYFIFIVIPTYYLQKYIVSK